MYPYPPPWMMFPSRFFPGDEPKEKPRLRVNAQGLREVLRSRMGFEYDLTIVFHGDSYRALTDAQLGVLADALDARSVATTLEVALVQWAQRQAEHLAAVSVCEAMRDLVHYARLDVAKFAISGIGKLNYPRGSCEALGEHQARMEQRGWRRVEMRHAEVGMVLLWSSELGGTETWFRVKRLFKTRGPDIQQYPAGTISTWYEDHKFWTHSEIGPEQETP